MPTTIDSSIDYSTYMGQFAPMYIPKELIEKSQNFPISIKLR